MNRYTLFFALLLLCSCAASRQIPKERKKPVIVKQDLKYYGIAFIVGYVIGDHFRDSIFNRD